jgi:hypothetical protein
LLSLRNKKFFYYYTGVWPKLNKLDTTYSNSKYLNTKVGYRILNSNKKIFNISLFFKYSTIFLNMNNIQYNIIKTVFYYNTNIVNLLCFLISFLKKSLDTSSLAYTNIINVKNFKKLSMVKFI